MQLNYKRKKKKKRNQIGHTHKHVLKARIKQQKTLGFSKHVHCTCAALYT